MPAGIIDRQIFNFLAVKMAVHRSDVIQRYQLALYSERFPGRITYRRRSQQPFVTNQTRDSRFARPRPPPAKSLSNSIVHHCQ